MKPKKGSVALCKEFTDEMDAMRDRSTFIRFGEYDGSANRQPVYRNGAHVGDIKGTAFGWQYKPKGVTDNRVSRLTWTFIARLREHLEANL